MSTTDLGRWRDTCQTCGAPVLQATSPTHGGPAPVNPHPHPLGNVVLAIHNGQLIAGVLRRNQAAGARDQGRALHTVHTDCYPQVHTRRRTR